VGIALSLCFFESHSCENCGHLSGFRDEDRKMLTFDPNTEFLISDREKNINIAK
jgi:hypothetical protein